MLILSFDFEDSDEKIERYLSHQMTNEEEDAFKKELENSSDLQQRAVAIAMVIKAMREVGHERDEKILLELRNMHKDEAHKTIEADDGTRSQWTNTIAMVLKTMQAKKEREKELTDDVMFSAREVGKHREISKIEPYKLSYKIPEIQEIPSHEVKKTKRSNKRYYMYAIAACIIGVILLVNWGWNYNKTANLGQDNYAAYTFYESGQNRGASVPTEIKSLDVLFSNVKDGKDLKTTISNLKNLYEASKDENSIYNDYEDDIAWNLSIAYLKKGNRKKAISCLEDIVERNEGYPEVAKVAQDLIDKIKKL